MAVADGEVYCWIQPQRGRPAAAAAAPGTTTSVQSSSTWHPDEGPAWLCGPCGRVGLVAMPQAAPGPAELLHFEVCPFMHQPSIHDPPHPPHARTLK